MSYIQKHYWGSLTYKSVTQDVLHVYKSITEDLLQTCLPQNTSVIYLVRTVCELTPSIIQMHYTRMTLFCLYLQKSFSIEDRWTLSPKTMHRVCCFCWRWRVLSWMVVVWSEFVSLVLCILPPLHWFCAATYHRQLQIQTRHIRWWLTSVKLWMQNRCSLV